MIHQGIKSYKHVCQWLNTLLYSSLHVAVSDLYSQIRLRYIGDSKGKSEKRISNKMLSGVFVLRNVYISAMHSHCFWKKVYFLQWVNRQRCCRCIMILNYIILPIFVEGDRNLWRFVEFIMINSYALILIYPWLILPPTSYRPFQSCLKKSFCLQDIPNTCRRDVISKHLF